MSRDFAVYLVSLFAGLGNFIYIAIILAFTSGGPGMSINEILANASLWGSLFHFAISSWIFFYINKQGRIIAIVSSCISSIALTLVLIHGFSILEFLMLSCFLFVIYSHANHLIKQPVVEDNNYKLLMSIIPVLAGLMIVLYIFNS